MVKNKCFLVKNKYDGIYFLSKRQVQIEGRLLYVIMSYNTLMVLQSNDRHAVMLVFNH